MNNQKLIISIIFTLIIGLFSQVKCQLYEHLIMYGQSLSTGQQSWPPLSTTAISNNYMIGSQVWTNYNNPVTNALNPLIATVALDAASTQPKTCAGQRTCECPIVATANYIQLKTSGGHKFIASSCGVGGRTIEQLSKEYYDKARYNDFTNCIKYAANVSANNIHCPAIFWMQGEYNYYLSTGPISFTATDGLLSGGLPTADKNRYKSLMLMLKSNMQNDIKAKYNQTDKPLFITYQVGKEYTKGLDMQIGMAQLEAANEYDDIVCAGPVYYLPDRAGHLDPNGYRWYGEMLGKVYYKTKVLGEDFRPLQPKEIFRSSTNPKMVIIKFLVPQLPLVLDINLTRKFADYGFQVFLNGTKVTLTSVAINNDCVELTSSSNLTGDLEVVYAGVNTIGKGNLRDSDPAVATSNYLDLDKKIDGVFVYEREATATTLHSYSGEPKDVNGNVIYDQPYPLYNFSMAFYYKLKKDDQSYVIRNLTPNTTFVNVSGVEISPTTQSLNVGSSLTITPIISPSNATNTSLLWTSSNPSIASVSDGVVTAIGVGTCNIYATSVDQSKSSSCVVTCNAINQTPYPNETIITIPETIQFENYDNGGEGTAYHDVTAGNYSGLYRPTENVDIEACIEGGYNIYSTSSGEWLEYTINVPKSQSYKLGIRYASTSTGKVNCYVNGIDVSGIISLPATYTGTTVLYNTCFSTINLNEGLQTIKFVIDASDTKFNYFIFNDVTGIYAPSASNDRQLIIYPNPANNYIFLEFESDLSKKVLNEVTDLTGRVLICDSFNSIEGKNNQKIDISNIPNGSYLVYIKTHNKASMKKLIINR